MNLPFLMDPINLKLLIFLGNGVPIFSRLMVIFLFIFFKILVLDF